jgi:hypothetical protein
MEAIPTGGVICSPPLWKCFSLRYDFDRGGNGKREGTRYTAEETVAKLRQGLCGSGCNPYARGVTEVTYYRW